MQIYLARNNVQAGPYSLEELNRMLSSGEVLLEDLMWHQGMTTWQKVGECTNGRLVYQPNTAPLPPTPAQSEVTSFGDNVDMRKDEPRRVTVAELYGRKPVGTDNEPQPKREETPPSVEPAEIWRGRHRTQGYGANTNAETGEVVMASVASRFLATTINGLLLVGAMFPFLQAFVALKPDPDKMNVGDFATRMSYAQELAQKIDSSQVVLTMIFMLGLFIVQIALIAKNGQSLGKFIAGIKIVDAKTRQKPSVGSVLGLRGVLLFLIYWLASAFGVNSILIVINYLMATFSKDKQGWHDKMAGTLVVKAKKVEKK